MGSELQRYGVVSNAACRVGFFLAPHFSMLPYVSAVEPLRVANRLSGRALYSWHLLSAEGGAVTAANGMVQQDTMALAAAGAFQVVVACGPHDPLPYRDRRVFAWLRTQASRGVQLGALDTGVFLLARARLLDGYRCTTHWENLDAFVREFPRLTVSGELFEFDRNRFSCAGGTAALDLMLHLIQHEHGHRLAAGVAEMFLHDAIRAPQAPQRMDLRARTGVAHEGLLRCLKRMEGSLESPLLPDELAAEARVSKRQLERLFRRWLGTTPSRYYMDLRLRLARSLLEQTSAPVTDVALAAGFTSPGHFSERFRASFGVSPRGYRSAAQSPPRQPPFTRAAAVAADV